MPSIGRSSRTIGRLASTGSLSPGDPCRLRNTWDTSRAQWRTRRWPSGGANGAAATRSRSAERLPFHRAIHILHRGERTATEPVELLRPQDVFFLHVETPQVQQHVCGLALIDPILPDGRKLGLEDLVRAVANRLDRLPRFRQRLAGPPLSLARPAWVDAEDFDVRFHVRGAKAPPPGGVRELGHVCFRWPWL